MIKHFDSCTVIINPRRYPKSVSKLEKILEKTDVSKVVISKSKENFIESVSEFYASENKNLLVWGGDGTAHDAINAVMNSSNNDSRKTRPKKSIGFLRGGSGNGIQDSYEVPHDIINPLEKQLRCYEDSIKNEYNIDVDLIKVDNGISQIYCQLAGFGFDVEVLRSREERRYRKGALAGEAVAGMKNYVLSTINAFFKRYDEMDNKFSFVLSEGKNVVIGHRTKAEHRFDDVSRVTSAPLIEIGTRPYYGRMFKICPDVVCNDGYMDVYLFNFEDKWDAARNIFWLYTGKHDKINKKFWKQNKPPIERYEVESVEVISDQPFYYHVDGELKFHSTKELDEYPIKFTIIPESINFLVPKQFYKSFNWFNEDDGFEE